MRANHIVYRGLQPHAAADATVSEKEACGLVEKDTGASAELTRRNSQKVTWSVSCLTWRCDCSAVVLGLCVFRNSSLDSVCMCGVGLFLSPSTSERGCSFIMYFFKAYAWLTQKVSLQKAYATLRLRACRFCLRTTSIRQHTE